jgi:inner membrane protein
MKIEINENRKWHQSVTVKLVLLGILGIFLLIPLEMIKSIIRERQKNSDEVKKEIGFLWAGQQNITGPVLNIPEQVYPVGKEGTPYREIFHVMPESLNITGKINTETRHRGIYKAAVYTADLKLSGYFSIKMPVSAERREILWDEAYFSAGISDNRGIKGVVSLSVDSEEITALPGLRDNDIFKSGITFPCSINSPGKTIAFSMNINLSGSESLTFSPVGKTTEINLSSLWKNPGFTGNFLPSESTVNNSGFKAKWLITDLNRNFPQEWTGSEYNPGEDSFGVNFILTVNHYQKSLRSAKYGILFIALTFLALLFAELTGKSRVHIFHYLLVSMALVLFFSLLNALSEHTGFNLAYLISAAATISLITLFLAALIKTRKAVVFVLLMLVIVYSFIFILLSLNDWAYLAGNIGLFILLAVTMRLSLKLDLFGKEQSESD